jgi:hypothetical protein
LENTKKFLGIGAIFGIPILYLCGFLFELIIPRSNSSLIVFFITILLIIWVFWMIVFPNPYGAEQIKQVVIPDIDDTLTDILKFTNRSGELVNLNLIVLFQDDKPHTRKEIKDGLEKRGINRSQPTVDGYVQDLVNSNLLASPDTDPYDKSYSLTQNGKLCLWIAETYFPATNLFFYWRYYVGVKGKRKKW